MPHQSYLSDVEVSQPEGRQVRDVPAAHEVHDPLVGEGVRLGATVMVFGGRNIRSHLIIIIITIIVRMH